MLLSGTQDGAGSEGRRTATISWRTRRFFDLDQVLSCRPIAQACRWSVKACARAAAGWRAGRLAAGFAPALPTGKQSGGFMADYSSWYWWLLPLLGLTERAWLTLPVAAVSVLLVGLACRRMQSGWRIGIVIASLVFGLYLGAFVAGVMAMRSGFEAMVSCSSLTGSIIDTMRGPDRPDKLRHALSLARAQPACKDGEADVLRQIEVMPVSIALSPEDLAAARELLRQRGASERPCGAEGSTVAGIAIRERGTAALQEVLDGWDAEWAQGRWCWPIQTWLGHYQVWCAEGRQAECAQAFPRERLQRLTPLNAVGSFAQDLIDIVWNGGKKGPQLPPGWEPGRSMPAARN